MLLHVKTSVCTRATITKDEETDAKASCMYVLALALSLLDVSVLSADTCFDMEQHTCPQPFAFPILFNQCTRIMPSTNVHTSFVTDLVLAKSVAVCKTSRQTQSLVQACTGCVLCGHIVIITKMSPHSILTKSTFLVCDSLSGYCQVSSRLTAMGISWAFPRKHLNALCRRKSYSGLLGLAVPPPNTCMVLGPCQDRMSQYC